MKRFIVWKDYGTEGWSPESADTFEEAVEIWKDKLSTGVGDFADCIITEAVPLVISDGRQKEATNEQ